MIWTIIVSALLGLLVWGIGLLFDTTPGNRNARIAGFVVFVVAVLAAILGLWHV